MDVTSDGLLVRQTKFKKSRLLPLHATTRAALDSISPAPARGRAEPHLFVSRRHGPLSRTVVTQTFHQVSRPQGFLSPRAVDVPG